MKKIAVIGGTGMTGQCVVLEALKKGHNVNLLYRDESTIPVDFADKVQLFKGDATDINSLKSLVKGCDGVVITLGTRNKLTPTTDLSVGTKNVIEAMKSENVSTVSACLSSFLFWDQDKVPPAFHNINEEHKKMLEILKNSGINYIAVLPPHIADEPSSAFQVLHDASPGRVVSKWDLAKFLVECLDQNEHYQRVVGIAKKG